MPWRLPAEWEPQESVWLVWPRDPNTWPDGRIEGARRSYLSAIGHLLANGRVNLVVHPDLEVDARAAVGDDPNLDWWPTKHVDSWIRDYGPLTIVDDAGERRLLDFRFDAWGKKYETLMADDAVTQRLAEAGAWKTEAVDFVLEGGAVDTDGQGTFLCTRSVAHARGQSETDVESILHEHLGARKILWLDEGVSGDDTDGHIDTITRFVGPATVVTTVEADMDHPDHDALMRNRAALQAMTDADGNPLSVIDLPLPDPITTDDGDPLPATHANFLIANGVVLVPTYGGMTDGVALDILRGCFPDRNVVGIDHRDLIWGFGGMHCLSMQIPSGAPL